MATGPDNLHPDNVLATMKTYRESFLNDGTRVRTYRRGLEGQTSPVTHHKGQKILDQTVQEATQRKNIGGSCWPGLEREDPGIMWYANEVSNPRSDEIETYNFRSLEEAMDHHDYLVAQDGSYTGSDDYREIGRFGQIQLDIESEE